MRIAINKQVQNVSSNIYVDYLHGADIAGYGTISEPFKTIGYAIEQLNSDDSIKLGVINILGDYISPDLITIYDSIKPIKITSSNRSTIIGATLLGHYSSSDGEIVVTTDYEPKRFFINGELYDVCASSQLPTTYHADVDDVDEQGEIYFYTCTSSDIELDGSTKDTKIQFIYRWISQLAEYISHTSESFVAKVSGDKRLGADMQCRVFNRPDDLSNNTFYYTENNGVYTSHIKCSLEEADVYSVRVTSNDIERDAKNTIMIANSSNISFENLRLIGGVDGSGITYYQGRMKTSGGLIQIDNSSNIKIKNCLFEKCDNYSIKFIESDNIYIQNNTFNDLLSGAICGHSYMTKGNTNIIITDNYINKYGLKYPDACGIGILCMEKGCISHNHIKDGYYTAISLGGVWGDADNHTSDNIIEFNWIHDIFNGVTTDGGAIYTLGVQPNTFIQYNFIYNILSSRNLGLRSLGLYHDQGSSFITDRYNIISNVDCGTGHGTNRIISFNNIFDNTKEYIVYISQPAYKDAAIRKRGTTLVFINNVCTRGVNFSLENFEEGLILIKENLFDDNYSGIKDRCENMVYTYDDSPYADVDNLDFTMDNGRREWFVWSNEKDHSNQVCFSTDFIPVVQGLTEYNYGML